ncbi:zinc finger protein OZF-like [Pimephales promelas]|uniref:zinc finger protein OZF-like n=1 Tax=Pimephales promelas TaxID=90988 RepID=UPI001955D158|nr:zinc finger protein OZF-like [Pimephales promelas]
MVDCVFLHGNVTAESFDSEMSSAGMFQTQISAIMKAAAVEISQLLEEEAAALHQEIRRRNQEIQGLKTELLRVTAERCSVGVQVELMDTSVTAHSREAQTDHRSQEKVVVKNLSEEKPHFTHAADVNAQLLKQEESVPPLKEPEEEELSGLEFEMKIEQVEELVDQTLGQVQEKQKCKGQNHCHDGNSRLWCSRKVFDHPENLVESEQHSQSFTDPYGMEDPTTTSTQSGLMAVLQNESFGVADIEYDLNLQDSHRHSPTTSSSDSTPFNTLPSSHSSSCLPKTLPQSLNAGKHTEPKPFRCDECGKGFPQRGRLVQHKLVHSKEKPFRCEECGIRFTQKNRLLTHKKQVHTNERPFRCDECGKGFPQRARLLTHKKRVHTNERPFRCEECGKGFVLRGRLLTHKLVHSKEKPFRCEECGRSFTERKRLLTHKLVHTGEKPFCCQVCGNTFSRQDSCLRHMRLHRRPR